MSPTVGSTPNWSRLLHSGNALSHKAHVDADLLYRASVFALVKSPESSVAERITGIHALDYDLSRWWSEMQPDFKLDSRDEATVPKDRLGIILLLNLVYHQSLCALHASIIPLFSWSTADDGWFSARQSSAQIAFEHACMASTKINHVLSLHPDLIPTHSFIAYAAYSGCAIQMPFMWCLNATVQHRAITSIRANVKMIRQTAPYWKFAAILVKEFPRFQMFVY